MIRQARFWREAFLHGVNALGICAFIGFMLQWPHFYDSAPPFYWDRLFVGMVPDMAWLYLPVLFIDLLPLLFFWDEHGGAADFFAQPFCSAFVFGTIALLLVYAGFVQRSFSDEYYIVLSIESAGQAGFFFLLHFLPILVFETVVRSLWLLAERSRKWRAPGG